MFFFLIGKEATFIEIPEIIDHIGGLANQWSTGALDWYFGLVSPGSPGMEHRRFCFALPKHHWLVMLVVDQDL